MSTDDLISIHNKVSELERGIAHQERVLVELQRLGEPTTLAEKFLARLRAQLAERQEYLVVLTNIATNDDAS